MKRQERRQLTRQQEKAQRRSREAGSANGADDRGVAVQQQAAGQLPEVPEAEEIYRQILHKHHDRPQTLHLLDRAPHRAGQHSRAIQPRTGDDALAAAREHHQAGRLRQAEEIYRRILQKQPNHPEALHLLGLAAYQSGRHDQAMQSIGRAIALNPRDPGFHNDLALVLVGQGQTEEALASLRRALALKPDFAEAHHNLGVALGEQGKLDEAVDHLRRALALKPDYPEAHSNLGLTLAAQGQPEEAVASLRRAVALRPDSVEAHSNLGVTLAAQGQHEEAVASLRRAVALRPDSAVVHNILGTTLRNQGKTEEAVESLRRALALQPDFVEAYHNLGVALGDRGQHDEAVASLRRAAVLRPDYAEAHSNLGVMLRAQGKLDEAADSLRRAVELKPDHAEAHNNLGCVLRDRGDRDVALESFRRAVALMPDYAEAHSNLGLTLMEQGEPAAAAESLRRAVALKPDYVEAYSNLGIVLKNLRRLGEAEESLRRALALRPDYPEAHSNLAIVLGEQGKHDEAVASLRRALALRPDYAEAHSNLGAALRNLDRMEEAFASFQQAIALQPDYAEAHHNLAVMYGDLGELDEALASYQRAQTLKADYGEAYFGASLVRLARGDLERGFAEYESRWRCAELAGGKREGPQPQWDGSPLDGRTILLYAEQGLGDTLQFVRYAPLVAARGGRVILECQRELEPLLRGLDGVAQLVARGEALPPFDVHAPLLSLPDLLGTTLETVPAEIPYLRADPERVAAWAEYLEAEGAAELRVGLVWGGNPDNKGDRRRSLPLDALAPLAQVPGVRFFALQKGPAAAQADAPPAGLPLTNLGPLLTDFADTAAVLEQLDLVITVDTSVAHLAGALGRPVWVLLAFTPDWRWMRQREDSPWYPTARLFRQERLSDWPGVVARVSTALGEFAAAAPAQPARRRAPQPPAVADGAATSAMYVAVPLGGAHGWGVCGKYLAKELAHLGATRLVTDRIDADTVGDELERHFLERLAYRGLVAPADAPVLQCITGKEMLPYRPTLRGRFTAGYTFFEENLLPSTAIENARRNFDLVVTGSTWCQEVLEAHGLRDVRTIIQGIDPTVFFPTGGEKEYFRDQFVVFSGGKLELRKGQDLVIRAFKVLQDRHPDVLLVNAWHNMWEFSLNTMRVSPFIRFAPTATDHVGRVSQVLADNGVDLNRVITLLPRPNATFRQVYRNTDVGLFPNRCEGGTNLVLMEYMACGKPAIASYNSGHRDVVNDDNAMLIRTMKPVTIVENGRDMAIWDEPDLEETVERLEWAYQHREELRAIGDHAGQDLAQLTWKRSAEQFYEILANGVRGSVSSGLATPTKGATEPQRPPTGLVGADQAPAADATLLGPLERSPEYEAVRLRLVDHRPSDAWQEDGLHFFTFELRAMDNTATGLPEPPTAVFAMHPVSQELISAVVVTPGTNGDEPEIVDLRQPDRVPALANSA